MYIKRYKAKKEIRILLICIGDLFERELKGMGWVLKGMVPSSLYTPQGLQFES